VNRHPMVFIPLHKGADGFLSDEDFRRFYWPTLKKVLLGLIEQGIVPLCFAEGAYNERLEAIHDPEIPAGRMIGMFDATDMHEARKHLGGYQCFGGNVPGALITTGTRQAMDDYVRKLIEDMAVPGGFILGTGIVVDEAKPACMKALIEAGLKYGAEV
jgi:uroporphyrinogen-III decarboxylase